MNSIKRIFVTGIVFVSAVSFLHAEDAPAKVWKETAQITYLSANGNTKSTTLGVTQLLQGNWKHVGLDIGANALGSSNKQVTTAEQYNAFEKVSWKLDDRNYAFERAGWDKNRFAGIANRIDSSLGLGRELVKTAKNNFLAELGGGYINEQRVKAPREDFASGRAYAKYVRAISATSNFSQDAEYLHNFENPDGFRANTETALIASVSTNISMKLSYVWKHVAQPAPGFGKNDTLTSMALIFNY